MVITKIRYLDGYYQHEIPGCVITDMQHLDSYYSHEILEC